MRAVKNQTFFKVGQTAAGKPAEKYGHNHPCNAKIHAGN